MTTSWSGHYTDHTKPPLAQQSMPEPAASPVSVLGRKESRQLADCPPAAPNGGVRAHAWFVQSEGGMAAAWGWPRSISSPAHGRPPASPTRMGRLTWRVNARAEPSKLGEDRRKETAPSRTHVGRAAPQPTHTPRLCPVPRPLDTWNPAWPGMAWLIKLRSRAN
jgi:hypothetical protein